MGACVERRGTAASENAETSMLQLTIQIEVNGN
jgi:hypothetical protein